jgi:hypothetical protein
MSIDWFRDLVISISGLVLIGVLIFITVLSYSLYRRVKSILDSVKTTSRTIQGVSSYVGDEVVKPITQIVALIQGIRQGIDAVSNLFRKKEG